MQTIKSLIPERVMLIGEGGIPPEIIESLPDHLLQIFMREADPADWPTELEHLVVYLPEHERLRYVMARVLRRHDELLVTALEKWARTAWRDLVENEGFSPHQRHAIEETMAEYVKSLITECLAERQD